MTTKMIAKLVCRNVMFGILMGPVLAMAVIFAGRTLSVWKNVLYVTPMDRAPAMHPIIAGLMQAVLRTARFVIPTAPAQVMAQTSATNVSVSF